MSQFDHYQLQVIYPTVEHCSPTNLQQENLHTSHSTFSIHCPDLSLCFIWVFTFLKIIKHNMLKMLHIFFHLQYENGYIKIHQFWCFLKCTLIWQLDCIWQYNQTKIFWMKLRTTKHYESHLMGKKTNTLFGQSNIIMILKKMTLNKNLLINCRCYYIFWLFLIQILCK